MTYSTGIFIMAIESSGTPGRSCGIDFDERLHLRIVIVQVCGTTSHVRDGDSILIPKSLIELRYRTAICIDVLEHITDDRLPGLFENLKQADHQVVTVYCGPSKERGYNQQLHPNVKTPSEWATLLSEHFDIAETIQLATHCYLYLMRRKDAVTN